jgi:phage terminase large subunit
MKNRLLGIVYQVNLIMYLLYRIIVHEGGSRSGKTYNTVEFLIDYALLNAGVEITMASRDMPHLKKGVMKDFLDIMIKRKLYRDDAWHQTDKKYTFKNGSYIEFFNADDLGKVSGPGRDVLFCNEVNFFKWVVFQQLLLRTRKFCIVDYNPIHPRHWVYDKILKRKDCYVWKSTYKDNIKFLPAEQVLEIEMMRETDPIAWQVYGLGLRASYQKGQIYGQKPFKPWQDITLTEYMTIDAPEIFGLDWGFFPDPNAVIGTKAVGNKRYYRKIVYKQNQTDEQLAEDLKEAGLTKKSIFVADHQKKSILKLRELGFPLVYQAVKPPGSVDAGIKLLRSKETYYVGDPDLEFEYTNYCYLLGPDDEPTGTPIDKHNHAMDAIRMVELYREYL